MCSWLQIDVAMPMILYAQVKGQAKVELTPRHPCNETCPTVYATMHEGEMCKWPLLVHTTMNLSTIYSGKLVDRILECYLLILCIFSGGNRFNVESVLHASGWSRDNCHCCRRSLWLKRPIRYCFQISIFCTKCVSTALPM